jgi:hypothetical protein
VDDGKRKKEIDRLVANQSKMKIRFEQQVTKTKEVVANLQNEVKTLKTNTRTHEQVSNNLRKQDDTDAFNKCNRKRKQDETNPKSDISEKCKEPIYIVDDEIATNGNDKNNNYTTRIN